MLGRRRARSVDAAAVDDVVTRLLGSEGLLAVTAARVGAELGASAEDVVAAVDLDRVVGDAYGRLGVAELAQVKRTILANPSPAEQMRALLTWLSTAPEEGDAVRLEAYALARRNRHLRTALVAGEAAWHGLVASVVRRGARSGDFLPADADEIAAHIIAVVDGINAYELIGYRSDFDRLRLLTRVVQAELGLAWGPELASALS